MSLGFETTYQFNRSPHTPRTIARASEVEVWVGWSDGIITIHTSLNLEYTLDIGYYFDNQTVNIPGTEIGVSRSGLRNMVKWYDKMYLLFDTAPQIVVYDIPTRSFVRDATIGISIGSDIAAANGRLWIVNKSINSNMQNELLSIDVANGATASYAIPLRHQSTDRSIIDGLDGRLYVTQYNNHGIASFDLESNTFTASYKLSRHPTTLNVNQNKQLYVSTSGSVILFNQSTNTGSAFCANMGHSTLLDDFRTGYMWMLGGGAPTNRMIKASIGIIAAGEQGLLPNNLRQVAVLTENFTYDKYDPVTDTVAPYTVRPHLFICTGTGVIAYRATALKGVNSSQILGTGMASIGPFAFYGE